MLADRQTRTQTQTHVLITILRSISGGKVTKQQISHRGEDCCRLLLTVMFEHEATGDSRFRSFPVPRAVTDDTLSSKLVAPEIRKTSYRPGGGETICPPADGSSTVIYRFAANQKSRRIYVRPRTGPQSAHLWWPGRRWLSCRQPACL